MADEDFDRSMGSADWDEVFERQKARGDIIPQIESALKLEPGDTVLDVGSGPGYTALQLANHENIDTLYVIDRHLDALKYLRGQAASAGISNIHPITTDAGTLALAFDRPVKALLAFVLHHDETPHAVLDSLATALPPGSTLLIIEYHPDEPGKVGPPVDRRIDPTRLKNWLTNTGVHHSTQNSFPEEKYAVRAQIPSA